jgi:sugar lactone lactonase YvrE
MNRIALFLTFTLAHQTTSQPPAEPEKWLPATAYAVPKETAPEGEGYFSIIEGHNGRLYIGTHANGRNAWLVEFDPKTDHMRAVVDAQRVIGTEAKGFAAQAKIHTRNNVGASGKIYFGTKQGYPSKDEKWTDYPGGYPMVYDPKTGQTKVYPIPVPHQGISGITPDESRGVAYISTCSDHRPGPHESAHFLVLDLASSKYRDLMDTEHIYAFIVVDHRHRAYHPLRGGDIARYDPDSGRLEPLKQTIDGKPPAADSHLADAEGHPLNWDISPDGKTLYCVPMSTNQLYAYDLTDAASGASHGPGETLRGRSLGPLVPGAKDIDCRAMCVGPKGDFWAAVTVGSPLGIRLAHLVSYRLGDSKLLDLGPISIRNPDYTEFTDNAGKPLPGHGGIFKTPKGVTTTRHVLLGICQTREGSVYVLALQPYTVLCLSPEVLKK